MQITYGRVLPLCMLTVIILYPFKYFKGCLMLHLALVVAFSLCLTEMFPYSLNGLHVFSTWNKRGVFIVFSEPSQTSKIKLFVK